jgi:hypothetical protein
MMELLEVSLGIKARYYRELAIAAHQSSTKATTEAARRTYSILAEQWDRLASQLETVAEKTTPSGVSAHWASGFHSAM